MASSAFSCLAGGASPSRENGTRAALALLRLGKLGHRDSETLIIDVEDDRAGAANTCMRADSSSSSLSERRPTEATDRPVVEEDLCLEDYDSEDDARLPGSLPQPWAPGSAAARHLMKKRSQQCVVCMEDKEHTFVPPHSEDAPGGHVAGHRFCTDCWVEFLYHSSRQQRRGNTAPPLACPLCRGGIHVPDVWGVDFELPSAWLQPSEELAAQARTPSVCPTMEAEAEPLLLWAEAAPSAGASDAAASASASSECSPVQGSARQIRMDSFAVASCWNAFGCPMPAWQSGCFDRIREAFVGAAPAPQVRLTGDQEPELVRI